MSDQLPPYTTEDIESAEATSSSVPNDAEPFGTMRNESEPFGNIPHPSERNENHTMTVRAVARLFEAASVARTERSIVNWCQPNRQGIARLDAYYDVNERKWLITPESADRAIAEERMKAAQHGNATPLTAGETVRDAPKVAEVAESKPLSHPSQPSEHISELKKQVMDLKILNGGKDFLIERLSQERDGFIQKLVEGSRRIGQLETKLNQLAAPRHHSGDVESGAIDNPDQRETESGAKVD